MRMIELWTESKVKYYENLHPDEVQVSFLFHVKS